MFINLLLEKHSFSPLHGHLCGGGKRRGSDACPGRGKLVGEGKPPGPRSSGMQSSEMMCEVPPRRAEPRGVVDVSGRVTNTRRPGEHPLLMNLLPGRKRATSRAGRFIEGLGLQKTRCSGPTRSHTGRRSSHVAMLGTGVPASRTSSVEGTRWGPEECVLAVSVRTAALWLPRGSVREGDGPLCREQCVGAPVAVHTLVTGCSHSKLDTSRSRWNQEQGLDVPLGETSTGGPPV